MREGRLRMGGQTVAGTAWQMAWTLTREGLTSWISPEWGKDLLGVGSLHGLLEAQRICSLQTNTGFPEIWANATGWEFELPFGDTWWHHGASPWKLSETTGIFLV